MWVQCLDQEDPVEKEMATYSIILAWEIPRRGSLAGSHGGIKESDMT